MTFEAHDGFHENSQWDSAKEEILEKGRARSLLLDLKPNKQENQPPNQHVAKGIAAWFLVK